MQPFELHEVSSVFRVTALVNAAYYNLPEDFLFPGESHDFWEIIYVDRGQVVICHDEGSYLLKAGEMLPCMRCVNCVIPYRWPIQESLL